MKQIDITVFGLTMAYMVAANAEEFNTLAKDPDACYKAALAQELAHGSAGAIRATLCTILEGGEVTYKDSEGNEQKFKLETPLGKRQFLFGKDIVTAETVEKDGKSVVVYTNSKGKKLTEEQAAQVKRETEKSFFERVVAEQGKTAEDYKDLIVIAIAANPFDPSVSERKSAEARIGKTWLKVATEIVANGAHDRAAAQLGDLLGRVIDVSNPDTRIINLATAIQDNERLEAEARKNRYLAV